MDPDSEQVSESQTLLHCGEVEPPEGQNFVIRLYLAILSSLLNIDIFSNTSAQTFSGD